MEMEDLVMTENIYELLYAANQRVARLRLALDFALEMQAGVEHARPNGYGSPENTVDWMDAAKRALNDTTVPYA